MAYSLSAQGKRLRPALVLASFGALGGTGDAVQLASAVEIVHTYSLVHDDLPCMDDDDLRRGRPTTHRQFDVASAAEAGYRLVPLSARVLAAGAARLGLDAARTGAIAGGPGMIGGQVLDLEAEGRRLPLEELVRVHRWKTGALIAASAVIGALAAGAAPAEVEALRGYGLELGLAFQIVDDILDATGTSQDLGKTAGKDAAQAKATFVRVLGVEEAERAAAQHVERAVDILVAHEIDSILLESLARFVEDRQS
jgi:geranylgeranyl pyrophosphate synthase